MSLFEIIMIGVIILASFFINKYLSKIAPSKSEAIRLILFALLLGSFFYTTLGNGSPAKGSQYVLLIVLTVYFGYRSYKWIRQWNHKAQEK